MGKHQASLVERVNQALANGGSFLSADQVQVAIDQGNMAMFHDKSLDQFIILEELQEGDVQGLGIVAFDGSFSEGFEHWQQLLGNLCEARNYRFIQAQGRPGWERALEPLGVKRTGVILRRVI